MRCDTVILSPVLLGRGEALFSGLDLPALGYGVRDTVATELATHIALGRVGDIALGRVGDEALGRGAEV